MTNRLALTNGVIYTGYDCLEDHAILVDGSYIADIVARSAIPSDFVPVDLRGGCVCSGLIDLQVYGTGDHLFSAELTAGSLHAIEQGLLRQGCTSFMLTLATNTLEVFGEAISVFKASDPQVALGLHLEGPFLNSAKRGAHPAELIRTADTAVLAELLGDADGAVRMMTVAPELLADEYLRYLLDRRVLITAGHSNATAEQATAAFDKGVKAVTHLWNAMSPLHHRNVGLPGATFCHGRVMASIIGDGIHVDYDAVRLSKQLLGERLFLITDAVAACDRDIYHHRLNGDHYVLPDGTLSGSALSMLQAIRNCVVHVGIPLDEAIRMATLYPADLIGRSDLGRLEQGAAANILVFGADFQVREVYFHGARLGENAG